MPRAAVLLTTSIAFLLVTTAGCAPPNGRAAVHRSDSAGVAIMAYETLPDPAGSTIELADGPTLSLGGAGSPPEQEFSRIAGVVRLSDGRIVVGDAGSGELRFFDAQGGFLTRSGGAGEGPGEFRRLSFVGRLAGDSILAGDAALSRVQVFDPQGRYARGMTAGDGGPTWAPNPVGVTAEGRVLALQRTTPTPADFDKPVRVPTPVLLHDPARARWDTLATPPGAGQLIRAAERGVMMEVVAYGGHSDAAAGADIVALVDSDILGASIFSGGTLAAEIRVTSAPVPVTPEILALRAEEAMAVWPAGMSDEARQAFRQRALTGPHGANLPQVVSVEVDAIGRIWLNLLRHPGETGERFVVFSREGEWLAELTLPAGLDRGTTGADGPGMDIGRDYLLGVWRDGDGVETVRLYRLVERG